jgi:putative transposase
VDVLGNLLGVLVHAADVQEREAAEAVLDEFHPLWPEIRKIWADQAYTGDIVEWARQEYDVDLEVVKKQPDQEGFVVLAKRWVVERTFAWLGRFRRLSKDYEYYPESSASFAYLASIQLMLNRLFRPKRDIKPHRANYQRRYRD